MEIRSKITNLAYTVMRYATVRYGGYSSFGSHSLATLYNNGGEITIATSTVSNARTYGIRQASGTTTVSDSVIRDNGSYGAYNALTSTSTFLATNNYWNATSGPYHAGLNPDGEGEQISSYVDFEPWLGDQHNLFWTNAVDSTGGYHIQWKWDSDTESQDYAERWAAASTTWNELGIVDIRPYTSGVNDLYILEKDDGDDGNAGLYTPNFYVFLEDQIKLNLYYINNGNYGNYVDEVVQFIWTHELGHALGLDHSYWENVLYPVVTTQTTLGNQDVEDYNYCWVEENC